MYLTVGQWTIPIVWLAFLVAIFYSDMRNNDKHEATNTMISRLFWLYLVIWKGSYVLFSWDSFWQVPLSLVYFDGGLKGHILAALIGVAVVVWKRNVLKWDIVWRYWARLVAVSQFVSMLLSEQWLTAIFWLAVLLFVELKWQLWIFALQWLLLVWLNGLLDAYVFVHLFIIISVLLKRKQMQVLALSAVFTLVALALTDFQKVGAVTERQPIDLPTTDGARYTIAEREERLTIVNFFATWCPPCQAEMPHLQSFSENLPPDVALVGVNLTARDNGDEALQNFMRKYKVTYPILLDETDVYGKGYEVLSIPTTVVLNADGQELARVVGPVSEGKLRAILKQYE